MNLLCLTSGPEVPSTRFRVLQFLPRFRELGHRATVCHSWPGKYRDVWPLLPNTNQRLREWKRRLDYTRAKFGRYDAILIERELFTNASTVYEELFARLELPIVLDLDDGVFLQHPDKFRKIFALSRLVLCGTQEIADYVAESGTAQCLIPTCVDHDRYRNASPVRPSVDRPVIIGWTGSSGTAAYLNEIVPALQQVGESIPIELHVMADAIDAFVQQNLTSVPVHFFPWDRDQEISRVHSFDLGIMPLPDNPWTRHKCGFKILQYMAAGVPVLASPVGVNARIVQHGRNGWLATTTAEWIDGIQTLAGSEELRTSFSHAGLQTVAAQYSLAAQFPRWLAALESVVPA